MVWHGLFPFGFHQLHGIIQEKVYQDGVDLGLWVLALNFPSDEFHTPDATSYIFTRLTNG
jgi:hypothetical protein